MVSSSRPDHARKDPVRTRKNPAERRSEIVQAASAIAIAEGLERITLRSVAQALGVRPGLISHYFNTVEDLVIEAFTSAAIQLRQRIPDVDGSPLDRVASIVAHLGGPAAIDQNRLWMSARNISRLSAAMSMAIEELEEIGRAHMSEIVDAGKEAGVFANVDTTSACVRIFMAIDGYGAYVNSPLPFSHDSYTYFVADVADWALGLKSGTIRGRIEELAPTSEANAQVRIH